MRSPAGHCVCPDTFTQWKKYRESLAVGGLTRLCICVVSVGVPLALVRLALLGRVASLGLGHIGNFVSDMRIEGKFRSLGVLEVTVFSFDRSDVCFAISSENKEN